MKTCRIVIDTREKSNDHIIQYLDHIKAGKVIETLKTGDYGIMIPKNETLGIKRDIYFNAAVERKAHIDELTGNLQKLTEQAFENELIRSQAYDFFLLIVEDKEGYEKMIKGQYRSKYDSKALLGRLTSLQTKYNFDIVYIDKRMSGHYIFHRLYYYVREQLKNGIII